MSTVAAFHAARDYHLPGYRAEWEFFEEDFPELKA
jgi:hypothetical protein